MKVINENGIQYLDLEDKEFDYITGESLVKQKFRMVEFWHEEVQRLEKELKELKDNLARIDKFLSRMNVQNEL